jgi:Mg-chelatase subunit ChlD
VKSAELWETGSKPTEKPEPVLKSEPVTKSEPPKEWKTESKEPAKITRARLAKSGSSWETASKARLSAPKADGRREGEAPAEASALGMSADSAPSGGAATAASSSFGVASPRAAAAPRAKSMAKESSRDRGERESHERRSSHFNLGPNILTAGSFDDRDDLGLFKRIWNETTLDTQTLSGVSGKSWESLQKFRPKRSHGKLQLALVIDTTGSMGDELSYIQAELRSIVASVQRDWPSVEKELAVIVYRDDGDDYVTRGITFTSDINAIQQFLDRQEAGGGGDYPEAVHVALQETVSRLDWSSDADTARMIFFVADAPAHDEQMSATFAAVRDFSEKGISIYPVAASGVMDVAEAMMRGAAVMTGGNYIFLTDDSGVGLSHAKPRHPCYNVEKLNHVMIRTIKDHIAGTRSQALASQIVRTVGSPNDQACPTSKQFVRTW